MLIDEKRFPGRQGRLLFAYLVAERGRPVPRDELAEAVWGGTPPATWEKALTVTISKLRGLLAESGLADPNTLTGAFGCYRLELPEGTWVDVIAAADAAEEAEAALGAGDLERAKALATHAGSLARPLFLPGQEGLWVDSKRGELAAILHRALSCLADASLLTDDPSVAGKAAEEAIRLEPYRESGYRRLMQAHAAAGNRAEALRVYERCRALLAEELGAFPSPETESFYRELLAVAPIETQAPDSHDARPQTDYAKSGDIHIAYQCLGDGPVNLVFVPGFVSHVEHFWEDPSLARFLRRLASFSRLVFFDKRGTGLSDRVSEAAMPTLEERMDDVRAVMDAVGFERAAIFAPSDAGALAILFAATYPERTTALVLYGAFAAGVKEPGYPWGMSPADWDARAERWREQWGRVVAYLDLFAPSKAGDERYREWFGRLERLAASPGAAAMLGRMCGDIDVRHVLPSVGAPTLVLHRRDEHVVPVDEGRFLAERIPGATFAEQDGADHWPWLGDADAVIEEMQVFLTEANEPSESDRVLATVLYTDVLGSAQSAGRDQHAAVRSALSRFRGREIAVSGYGLFATFDGPVRAIRCACAIVADAKRLGLDARAGLHTGECERIGDTVEGVAVQMCARVAAKAVAGEVLVSRTVKDLVAGSGIEFVDRGVQHLEEIPDAWQLFAVRREVDSKLERSTRDGPPSAAVDARLPTPSTPFVGREREILEVTDLLRRPDVPLLTLTGTGGTGKTRLAVQAAAALVDTFADGVVFVSLAPLKDPDLVLSTAAQALGVGATSRETLAADLARALRDRVLLLVLDNFEHLLAAAPSVADVAAGATGVKLLVTSRAPLHLSAEHVYPVSPLPTPDDAERIDGLLQCASVALFELRAQAVRPDFAVTSANAGAVADVCRALDGLPLAIELAASRVGTLPPAAMRRRLDHPLRLLVGGAQDAPERQRTLRATIDWSYALLEQAEQRLFVRLAVFAGGCTIEAAESVCGDDLDVVDGLASLIDRGLTRLEGSDDEPRFTMLETLREYAAERLALSAESSTLRGRHAEHFLALAEETEPNLIGVGIHTEWLDRLERDHDNFRAALDWLVASGDSEGALRLTAALWRFWDLKGHLIEGRHHLDSALRADERPTAWRAKALSGAADMALTCGDVATGRLRAGEALDLYRRLGDDWGIAFSLLMFAYGTGQEGDWPRAQQLFGESVQRFRDLGDEYYELRAARAHAWSYYEAGDLERSREIYEEILPRARATHHKLVEAIALSCLAEIAADERRFGDAISMLEESQGIVRELDDLLLIAAGVGRFAGVLALAGRAATSAQVLASSTALMEEIGAMPPWFAKLSEKALAAIRAQLDEAALAAAWEQGRALSADEAVVLALDALD